MSGWCEQAKDKLEHGVPFPECMTAVAKGVGSSISDKDETQN